nr:MAG TPA: hypothetical protein [Caudoviricetes sp.]
MPYISGYHAGRGILYLHGFQRRIPRLILRSSHFRECDFSHDAKNAEFHLYIIFEHKN